MDPDSDPGGPKTYGVDPTDPDPDPQLCCNVGKSSYCIDMFVCEAVWIPFLKSFWPERSFGYKGKISDLFVNKV